MSLYRLYKLGSKGDDDIMSYDDFVAIQKEWKEYYKSQDRKTRKYSKPAPKRSLPYNSAKMCHRPAHAYVPSKQGLFLCEKINRGEKLTEEERKIGFHGIWQRQVKFAPIIGYRTYFSSISLDAGWFSTSLVESYETKENGDVVLNTANSVYVAELAQDEEGHWKELDEKTEKELQENE